MKTERRHELQTNVLADRLAHVIEASRPYSRLMTAGVLAILLVIGIYLYRARESAQRLVEGWDQYLLVTATGDDPRKLGEIVENYGGTPAANWARLRQGDRALATGIDMLATDKPDAKDQLTRAVESYEAILQQQPDAVLRQRTEYSMAEANEAIIRLEEARKLYKAVASNDNDPYAFLAERRARDLEQESIKSFYDWFNKYTRPRPMANEPGIPGFKQPFNDDSLPSDSKLPSVLDGKTPLGEPGAPTPEPSSPEKTAPVGGAKEGSPASPVTPAPEAAAKKPPAAKPEEAAPSTAPK